MFQILSEFAWDQVCKLSGCAGILACSQGVGLSLDWLVHCFFLFRTEVLNKIMDGFMDIHGHQRINPHDSADPVA